MAERCQHNALGQRQSPKGSAVRSLAPPAGVQDFSCAVARRSPPQKTSGDLRLPSDNPSGCPIQNVQTAGRAGAPTFNDGQSHPKPHQSHPQATCKPSTWERIATHKPPACDPQATPKPLQSHPKTRTKPLSWTTGLLREAGAAFFLGFMDGGGDGSGSGRVGGLRGRVRVCSSRRL